MEAPHTIASIPKPLDPIEGQIRCSPVHSLTAGRKRKRHEVAVAIDGETVNIYNVQSQSIAASYPLPPQTFLCCPPCSTYRKATKQAKGQRTTHLVVRDGPRDAKRKLLCLVEDISKHRGEDSIAIAPARRDVKLPAGDILAVEAVEISQTDPSYCSEALVYYEDGRVVLSNGETVHEVNHDRGDDDSTIAVEFATTLDISAARKSLLASRDDLVAELDAQTRDRGLRYVVCRVVRSSSKRWFQMLALSVKGHNAISTGTEALHLVSSSELPTTVKSLKIPCTYELHASSGTLYQCSGGKLTILDLPGSMAHIKLRKGDPDSAIASALHLTDSTFVAVDTNRAAIFETTYGSLVASTALSAESVTENGKRQRAEGVTELSSFRPLSFYKDLGLIVGLVGTGLVGIQLSDTLPRTKRAKLSDVLSAHSRNLRPDRDSALQKIERWSAQLREAVASQNWHAVESLVRSALHRAGAKKRLVATNSDHVESKNGAMVHFTPDSSFDLVHLDQTKIRDLIRALFRVQDSSSDSTGTSRLALTVPSAQVYHDLACAGLLTLANIRSAVGTETLIQPGDIMRAIVASDGTFQVMHELVNMSAQWELHELVQGLNLLIQSFETSADVVETTTMANHKAMAPVDTTIVNGDADTHLEQQSLLAERELDLAMAALQNGLQLRSELFRTILDRLAAFPPNLLTKCMHEMIRPTELVFFIRILRIEVISGGWLDRYISAEADLSEASNQATPASILDSDHSPADAAIRQIGLLVNCAVDATGLNGWLVGESADTLGTTSLIHEMRSEISAVLEGLYELKALDVLTEEIERCWSVHKQMRAIGPQSNRSGAKRVFKTDQDRALPFNASSIVPARPLKAGDAGKKSSRALAAEERAKIGQYTFERIRV